MDRKKRDAKRSSRRGTSGGDGEGDGSFISLPVPTAFSVRGRGSSSKSKKAVPGKASTTRDDAEDAVAGGPLQTTDPSPPPPLDSLASTSTTPGRRTYKEIFQSQRFEQKSRTSQPPVSSDNKDSKKRWVNSHGASEWETKAAVDDAITKDLRALEDDEPVTLQWDQDNDDAARHLGTAYSARCRWKVERVLDGERGKWNVFLDKVTDSDASGSYIGNRPPSAPGAYRSMSNAVNPSRDDDPLEESDSSSQRRVIPSNQTVNEILVEASLVTSAEFQTSVAPSLPTYVSSGPLVEATPVPQGNKRKFIVVGSGLVFVIALALGLSLGLSLKSSPNETLPSQAPSAAPTTVETGEFYDSLPGDTRNAINDSTSPPAQAFRWVTRMTAQPTTLQRMALATLYFSTRGAQWATIGDTKMQWLTESHECDWFGVICDASNEAVKLSLPNMRLAGPLPREIGLLAPSLQHLLLGSNSLTGQVPSTLGLLASLTLLDLSINFLTGPIPSEIGNLQQLTQLSLFKNNLTDAIPAEFYDLASLEVVQLYENPLTGSLRTELGNLTKLTALNLAKNFLTGSIPTELGLLSNLVNINLSGLKLSGRIPSEMGMLTRLSQCSIRDTQLNSTIPHEIGNATNLEKLFLYGNQLSGEIPTEIALLSKLTDLELDTNRLRGTISTDLGLLSGLTDLRLFSNDLEGPIPSELGGLSRLKNLELFGNRLSQSIPSQVARLPNLEVLHLYDNVLNGTLPASFSSDLTQLFLYNNSLTGTVSSVVCDLIESNGLNVTLDCNDDIVCQCGCTCV